jgi:hypothetical protein
VVDSAPEKKRTTPMKNQKMLNTLFASMLMLVFCLSSGSSVMAQTTASAVTTKDCCMMKGGKMMCLKDGITMAMDKDQTMANGTVCKTTGECVMANGQSKQMKNGECIDMKGNIEKCGTVTKTSTTKRKTRVVKRSSKKTE